MQNVRHDEARMRQRQRMKRAQTYTSGGAAFTPLQSSIISVQVVGNLVSGLVFDSACSRS